MTSLSPVWVDIDLVCSSKKTLLKTLSTMASEALPVTEGDVFEAVITREKLGTTGVGAGVALPNGTVAGLTTPKSLFVRLKRAVDFGAIDDEPVDLVFCHLSPMDISESERLLSLSKINKLIMSPAFQAVVRGAESRSAIKAIFDEALAA